MNGAHASAACRKVSNMTTAYSTRHKEANACRRRYGLGSVRYKTTEGNYVQPNETIKSINAHAIKQPCQSSNHSRDAIDKVHAHPESKSKHRRLTWQGVDRKETIRRQWKHSLHQLRKRDHLGSRNHLNPPPRGGFDQERLWLTHHRMVFRAWWVGRLATDSGQWAEHSRLTDGAITEPVALLDCLSFSFFSLWRLNFRYSRTCSTHTAVGPHTWTVALPYRVPLSHGVGYSMQVITRLLPDSTR